MSEQIQQLTQSERPPVGLFDFVRLEDLVVTISKVVGLPAPEVYERLFREAMQNGWNVRRAAEAFGVTPHIYNDAMEAFYGQTDAFVFELAVVHQHPACMEIDRRVVEVVEDCGHTTGPRHSLLLLGDGIGSDSLRFASAGYPVTYFEYMGFSASLALARFKNRRLHNQIQVIHQLTEIPKASFDFVICREVLEHVSNPPEVIANIWSYLAPGGIAIITESFNRVEPFLPTHLASNLQFAGRTESLFVEAGFQFRRAYARRRPMVFQKTDQEDASRFTSLPKVSLVRRLLRGMKRRSILLLGN